MAILSIAILPIETSFLAHEVKPSNKDSVLNLLPTQGAHGMSLQSGRVFRKSITEFGAIPNDNLDDTSAIQRAIDEAAKAGGGIVDIPKGVYLVSINPKARQSPAIVLHSNIILQGEGANQSIIKLAAHQGNYEAIFGAKTFSTPINNFGIYDLGIDGNGSNNPVNDEQDLQATDLYRYAVRIFIGENIKIERNRFFNQACANTITVNGDRVKNVVISKNTFDLIGGGKADYDHSTIYAHGSQMTITNNRFFSRFGSGTKGARAALDIHGDDYIITGNEIVGYLYGIHATGVNIPHGSSNQLYANNLIKNVSSGIVLWSNHADQRHEDAALSNIRILGNRITIDAAGWQGFFDEEPRSGIVFEPNRNAAIQNVSIVDNDIVFNNSQAVANKIDYMASGITLWKYKHPNVPVSNIKIINNTITNAPGSGVYLNSKLEDATITGNTIINAGQSRYRFEKIYRSAIVIDHHVRKVEVSANTFVNSASTMRFGVVTLATCSASCSVTRNYARVNAETPFTLFFQPVNPAPSQWMTAN